MPQPPVQPFDDPGLKAALGRALGREAAPADLRSRILAATAGEQKSTPPNRRTADRSDQPIPLRRHPLYRLAVAAVLIIGFGALAYQIWDMNRAPKYDVAYAIPNSLYKAMVDTHTARLTHPAGDSVTTLPAAASLSGEVKRPVFAADLTKDGWKFEGGAVRDVGGHPTPQLFFTKGKASLSVFSLPASAAPGARDNTDYATSFNNSPIAGFMKGNGLYCIVGSSPDNSLPLDEVKQLLDRHRGELTRG